MEETKENLEKMSGYGISEGISEIILTTRNTAKDTGKKYNAAPIGIIWKNDKMFLHLFKGTNTCRNLMTEDFFAANITDDAVLYVLSTFYDLEDDEFLTVPAEEYSTKKQIDASPECETAEYNTVEYDAAEHDAAEHATTRYDTVGYDAVERDAAVKKIPVLKNACRFVLFKCLSKTDALDSVIIDIEPAGFGKQNEDKRQFVNRGFNSVIEACVHLTRYERTKNPIYIDHIRHHFGLIQRCGRKRDKEGLAVLKKRLTEIESENKTDM